MITQAEQSDLIRELDLFDAYAYEEFTSAAGIRGNFKICLPEALKKSTELTQRFVGHMAAKLTGVDVIAATGGAIDIASIISSETGLPLAEIKKSHNGNFKSANATSSVIFAKKPKIGFVEDVTSTRITTERAIHSVGIRGLIDIVVAGWRRGTPAPMDMTTEEVMEHNRRFNFRDLFEVPTDLPIVSVIERKIPLWLPTKSMVYARLPELIKEEA